MRVGVLRVLMRQLRPLARLTAAFFMRARRVDRGLMKSLDLGECLRAKWRQPLGQGLRAGFEFLARCVAMRLFFLMALPRIFMLDAPLIKLRFGPARHLGRRVERGLILIPGVAPRARLLKARVKIVASVCVL